MRRKRSPVTLVVLAAVLTPGTATRAQEQVPGTRAEVVQLDVIVTDAEGKAVRGLTRDDFAVFEDKKAQRLTNFVFVEGRLRAQGAAAPAAAEPAPAAAEAQAAAEKPSSPGRHLVIVIDDLHIAPGNLEFVKGALRRLVDSFLGPDDFAALLTTSAPAAARQLSQDAATIKQQVTQLTFKQAPSPPAAGTEMTPAQAELILRGDRSARRLAGRKLIDQPGSVLNPTSPRAATEEGSGAIAAAGGAAAASPEAMEAVAEREAERQARAVLSDALRYSAASLQTIEDVLRSLAPLPGRKLCLLVSDGFLVGTGTSEERTRDLRAIVDAATRSGAVVYAVDSRGLQGSMGDAGVAGTAAPAGLQTSVDRQSSQLFRTTLETISADTGGFLVSGTNAFDAGLRRVLADNDSYYLMAYEPSNKKRDGRFRRIEVKLPRHASHVVRTRRGYLAPDDSKGSGRAAVRTASATPEPRGIVESEARAILDAARRETGLPVSLAADYVDLPPTGPLAILRVHVDVAALAAEGGDAAPFAVDILGGVYGAAGQAVGPAFGRRTDVAAAAVARARQDGVQFYQRLALPPGRYEIRLAARDAGLSHLGGASQWVDIPDLEDGTLALSGLFLSTSTPKGGGPGGDAAGEDLRDVQALRRFKAGDNLFFQVYVYNLREHADGGSDAVLQAQLRQGEALVAASQPQPVKVQRKDGTLLPQTNGMPLEGLARGRYELRVVVMDKKANATISRQIDFTIE
jgi:VWFA-related protein